MPADAKLMAIDQPFSWFLTLQKGSGKLDLAGWKDIYGKVARICDELMHLALYLDGDGNERGRKGDLRYPIGKDDKWVPVSRCAYEVEPV